MEKVFVWITAAMVLLLRGMEMEAEYVPGLIYKL
jgi:hypothetical protein